MDIFFEDYEEKYILSQIKEIEECLDRMLTRQNNETVTDRVEKLLLNDFNLVNYEFKSNNDMWEKLQSFLDKGISLLENEIKKFDFSSLFLILMIFENTLAFISLVNSGNTFIWPMSNRKRFPLLSEKIEGIKNKPDEVALFKVILSSKTGELKKAGDVTFNTILFLNQKNLILSESENIIKIEELQKLLELSLLLTKWNVLKMRLKSEKDLYKKVVIRNQIIEQNDNKEKFVDLATSKYTSFLENGRSDDLELAMLRSIYKKHINYDIDNLSKVAISIPNFKIVNKQQIQDYFKQNSCLKTFYSMFEMITLKYKNELKEKFIFNNEVKLSRRCFIQISSDAFVTAAFIYLQGLTIMETRMNDENFSPNKIINKEVKRLISEFELTRIAEDLSKKMYGIK